MAQTDSFGKRCPSCGACKECGAPSPMIPAPYPYPVPVSPWPSPWRSPTTIPTTTPIYPTTPIYTYTSNVSQSH